MHLQTVEVIGIYLCVVMFKLGTIIRYLIFLNFEKISFGYHWFDVTTTNK